MYDVKFFYKNSFSKCRFMYILIYTLNSTRVFLSSFHPRKFFLLSLSLFCVWLIALVLNKNFIFHSVFSFFFCASFNENAQHKYILKLIIVRMKFSLNENWNVNYENLWNLIARALFLLLVGDELNNENLFFF